MWRFGSEANPILVYKIREKKKGVGNTVVSVVIFEVSMILMDWARLASRSGDTTADLLAEPRAAYLLTVPMLPSGREDNNADDDRVPCACACACALVSFVIW